VINKKTHSPHQSVVGIYITYSKKEEAERAIEAVDNIIFDGRQVKYVILIKFNNFIYLFLLFQNIKFFNDYIERHMVQQNIVHSI